MSDQEQAILEGHIAISAALDSSSRPIHRLYLDRTRRDRGGHRARLARRAADLGIPVEHVDSAAIDSLTSGQTHGGAAAICGPRQFVTLEDLLPPGAPAPFIAMIDGVEDPFNFGQAIRALYAAGADGVVVRPRNWMSAASVVARSSAGASEWMPTAIAETAEDAAQFYRARGLTIATTAHKRAVSLYDADLSGPLFILVGGEKRGITRSFLDQADVLLEIPYGRAYRQSLGTTAAAAVLAFEIMRQRLAAGRR